MFVELPWPLKLRVVTTSVSPSQCPTGYPSHAFVHVVAVGTTVSIHGMTVHDGELIHADRHGAAIIPHEVADKVPAAVELGARREKVILDAAKARGFGIAKLREALAKMAEIH